MITVATMFESINKICNNTHTITFSTTPLPINTDSQNVWSLYKCSSTGDVRRTSALKSRQRVTEGIFGSLWLYVSGTQSLQPAGTLQLIMSFIRGIRHSSLDYFRPHSTPTLRRNHTLMLLITASCMSCVCVYMCERAQDRGTLCSAAAQGDGGCWFQWN